MITKNPYLIVPILFLLLSVVPGSALVILPDGTEVQKDQIPDIFFDPSLNMSKGPLQFFYDYDCQSCQQALEYL